MPAEMFLFFLGQIVTAAGIYAALRADLADLKARAHMSERRLDRLEDRK